MNIILLLYTVHKRGIFHLAKWYMHLKILSYNVPKSVIFHPKTCYVCTVLFRRSWTLEVSHSKLRVWHLAPLPLLLAQPQPAPDSDSDLADWPANVTGRGTHDHFPCTAHQGTHQSMLADRLGNSKSARSSGSGRTSSRISCGTGSGRLWCCPRNPENTCIP